jgi:mono/diheme cytochrome c family protein
MSSYASQISPEDRWAIVHYIRAVQRAKKPTSEDLKTVSN